MIQSQSPVCLEGDRARCSAPDASYRLHHPPGVLGQARGDATAGCRAAEVSVCALEQSYFLASCK